MTRNDVNILFNFQQPFQQVMIPHVAIVDFLTIVLAVLVVMNGLLLIGLIFMWGIGNIEPPDPKESLNKLGSLTKLKNKENKELESFNQEDNSRSQ